MRNLQSTVMGLDLGQRNDQSALAILDIVEEIGTERDPVTFAFQRSQHLYLRSLTRFPRGTRYIDTPELVREVITVPPPGYLGRRLDEVLAVDAGGPGMAVVELLRQLKLHAAIMPAVITGGTIGSPLGGGIHSIPRRTLVNLLRFALESRQLVFPADMPLKDSLAAELAAVEPDGGQSAHDDMAIAIALALWAATKRFPSLLRRR